MKENLIVAPQSMSSLQIAEITGKRHRDVMRDIRALLKQGCNERNFAPVEYTDQKGEKRPCFNLTKKGCLILASGYNALLREKIIDRWETLENSRANLNNQLSRKELALMVVQAEEEKEQLLLANRCQQDTIDKQTEQIKLLAPKANYTDEVLQSASTYTLTQCAKELNFRSVTAFIAELKERNIIFKQSGQYQLTSRYAGNGYTTSRTARYFRSDGTPQTSTSTVVTEKGRQWLHSIFN